MRTTRKIDVKTHKLKNWIIGKVKSYKFFVPLNFISYFTKFDLQHFS